MLFNTPLIIFKALSKGNNSHNFANPFPIKSFEKYIPLVKQTSCTIILPTPPDAFSLTRLPINIPNAINNIETRALRVKDLMLEWSKDDNIWIKRTAIEHQLNLKDKTDYELLEKIIVNNFGTDEFFINKAIGWALREYSKTNSTWVKEFINRYKNQMSDLSIKEASKYI